MDITSFPCGIETENSTIPRHHSGNDIALSGVGRWLESNQHPPDAMAGHSAY